MSKVIKRISAACNTIFWLARWNFGRHDLMKDNDKERANLAVMLAEHGWRDEYPVKSVEVKDSDHAEITAAIEERRKYLESLVMDSVFEYPTNPKTKLNAAQILSAFKLRWYKGDKIHMPKYLGVFAYQRADALDEANALLANSGKEQVSSIPIIVMEYANDAERIKDCSDENLVKNAGNKPVENHWPSLCKAAKPYFHARGGMVTESEITDLVSGGDANSAKVGRGQKMYALLVLDAKYPTLGIIDKKILTAGTGMFNGKKDVDLGQAYAEALDRDTLRAMEKGTRDKAEKPVTEDEVSGYFADPFDKGTKVRPLTNNQLKVHKNVSPNLLTKYFIGNILGGNIEAIAALGNNPEILRACNELAVRFNLVEGQQTATPVK